MPPDTLEERCICFWSASKAWRENSLTVSEQELLLTTLCTFDWEDSPRLHNRLEKLKLEIDAHGLSTAELNIGD
jgi:hypothetical protein